MKALQIATILTLIAISFIFAGCTQEVAEDTRDTSGLNCITVSYLVDESIVDEVTVHTVEFTDYDYHSRCHFCSVSGTEGRRTLYLSENHTAFTYRFGFADVQSAGEAPYKVEIALIQLDELIGADRPDAPDSAFREMKEAEFNLARSNFLYVRISPRE